MDRQKIFDMAVEGLQSQGFYQSISVVDGAGNVDCQYRGEGNRKCAIGWLIADQDYTPGFEGLAVPSPDCEELYPPEDIRVVLYEKFREALYKTTGPIEKEEDWDFLVNLQLAHDEGKDPDAMMVALSEFAESWELNISTPL